MNTFSFPQISVNYKDADAAKRTLVNSSRVSYDIFKEAYDECMQHHEECWVMFLNQANRLLGLSCISKCGISQTVVDVRIILQTALLAHASGITSATTTRQATWWPAPVTMPSQANSRKPAKSLTSLSLTISSSRIQAI